jgi:hypothetical protein
VRSSLGGVRVGEGKIARGGTGPGELLKCEPALEYGVIDLDDGDWPREPQHVKDGSGTDWTAELQRLRLHADPVQEGSSLTGGRSHGSDDKGFRAQ